MIVNERNILNIIKNYSTPYNLATFVQKRDSLTHISLDLGHPCFPTAICLEDTFMPNPNTLTSHIS